jgi:hypothetical protein
MIADMVFGFLLDFFVLALFIFVFIVVVISFLFHFCSLLVFAGAGLQPVTFCRVPVGTDCKSAPAGITVIAMNVETGRAPSLLRVLVIASFLAMTGDLG